MTLEERIEEHLGLHDEPWKHDLILDYPGFARASLRIHRRHLAEPLMSALIQALTDLLGDPTLTEGHSYPVDHILCRLDYDRLLSKARGVASLEPLAFARMDEDSCVVVWPQFISVPRYMMSFAIRQIARVKVLKEVSHG